MMAVRKVAIDQFGEKALKPGEALEALRRKFVPIYLLHRYQVEAAAKSVGGVDYGYGVKGDKNAAAIVVPADRQRAALASLLSAMTPEALDTPERLIPLLSSGQSRAAPTARPRSKEIIPTAGEVGLRQPGRRGRGRGDRGRRPDHRAAASQSSGGPTPPRRQRTRRGRGDGQAARHRLRPGGRPSRRDRAPHPDPHGPATGLCRAPAGDLLRRGVGDRSGARGPRRQAEILARNRYRRARPPPASGGIAGGQGRAQAYPCGQPVAS